MKSQKINRPVETKQTTVLSEKTPKPIPDIQPTTKYPLRVINFVEVGSMGGGQIQLLMQELNATYDRAQGGVHYFLPIRNGKIGSDIVFEEEWTKIARETLEVNEDGEIQIKNGARDCEIIRRKI